MSCENCKDGKEVRRRWMTRMTKRLILWMMYIFWNSLNQNFSSWITYVQYFPIAALQLDHMSNSICTSSFLPVLNDRKVVVHLSLGNQIVTRASWRVIHLLRDHLMYPSFDKQESRVHVLHRRVNVLAWDNRLFFPHWSWNEVYFYCYFHDIDTDIALNRWSQRRLSFWSWS